MNFLSWTAEGVNVYLKDSVKFLTYDEVMLYVAVIGIAIGLMIGVVTSYFTRIYSHRAVKALLIEGCNTPETAKRIDELSTRSKSQIKSLLKTGKHLRRTVLCANEDEFTADGKGKKPAKTDFSVARFYIPEEKRIHAEVRYSREGMSPAALIITLAVIVGVAIGALYIIPELITMAENVFGSKAQ